MTLLYGIDPRTGERLEPGVPARGLVAELARLARELHRRRVFHKDLYFCHFYIPESFTRTVPADWTNHAVMIDLH
ncbi:MAG: lipopolysaccharide kinase InaA family protein, partial [Actinoallomurus sp.]